MVISIRMFHYSALAVGDSQARVPYKLLQPEHVIGFPPGISLTHPSNLSQDKLEIIYNNMSSIKFVGKFACSSYMFVRL